MTCYIYRHPYECTNPVILDGPGPHHLDGLVHVGKYVYTDTGEDICTPRPCPKCGNLPTPEGHDPCLGHLPGVRAACCGHGVEPPYIFTDDGRYISGQEDVDAYLTEVQKS